MAFYIQQHVEELTTARFKVTEMNKSTDYKERFKGEDDSSYFQSNRFSIW